jgi:hypothetical protein
MDGTKRPVGEWNQYPRRLAAGAELDQWFGPTQEAIGVVCGHVSGGLEMLEFEGRAVAQGLGSQWRDKLIASGHADLYRRVTDGYTEQTPSGGIHLFYRCEQIEGNKKLASSADGVLIETRGEGGFVVISPTTGNCHPSGNPWKILKGGFDTIATITEEERQTLHDHARALDQMPIRAVPEPPSGPQTSEPGDRPGDRYDTHPDALKRTYDLLVAHGWQHHHQGRDGAYYLTRPDKTTKDGYSATLGHPKTGGQGFYVFTTSSGFEAEHSYTPFQVLTILEHQGDYSAAARALAAENDEPTWSVTTGTPDLDQPTPVAGIQMLNLNEVATGIFADEQWLIEPVIPKRRQTSLYAVGKTGKSLLALEIACAAATGRPVLHEPTRPPIHVLYIDFEMTPSDLQERLDDLGYVPNDPDWPTFLQHMHYAMLQPFAPFDTREGGDQLVQVVENTQAELVVIDTLIRSVEGEENSADTIKNFNRYTGQRIKALGRTLVRIDHAGKDGTRGQRGTSAKRDDVDVVWRFKLDSTVEGIEHMRLINDASRMSWVPHELVLKRHQNPLRHVLPKLQLTGPEIDALEWLDQIGHPKIVGQTNTWRDLREQATEIGHTKQAVQKAQQYRKGSGA